MLPKQLHVMSTAVAKNWTHGAPLPDTTAKNWTQQRVFMVCSKLSRTLPRFIDVPSSSGLVESCCSFVIGFDWDSPARLRFVTVRCHRSTPRELRSRVSFPRLHELFDRASRSFALLVVSLPPFFSHHGQNAVFCVYLPCFLNLLIRL